MIRFLSRFVGLWMIAGALVALVVDGAKTIAASALTFTSLAQSWQYIAPQDYAAFETFMQKTAVPHAGTWLWDPVTLAILGAPGWLILGLVGGFLAYVGRKRRLTAAFA